MKKILILMLILSQVVGKINGQTGSKAIPDTCHTLPGDSLKALSECYLYKHTPQADLYLYLLRPAHQHHRKSPAIIYFSGGGWKSQSVAGQIPDAAWFRDQGIIGICADYRVESPHGTTPLEAIKDARSAVRYLRLHADSLGIDPKKIIVAGGSAGGHLAICTVIEGGDEEGENLSVSSRANALVLHNPVLGEGFGEGFFKAHPEFSPILQIKKGWPPTVLSCGTADKTTPFIYAEKFTEKMITAGNKCKLIPVPNADHSCDWPVSNPNFLPTIMQMTAFLKEEGFLGKK